MVLTLYYIVYSFLFAHHVGEDKYTFPFVTETSHENSIMQREAKEHLDLEVLLNSLMKSIDDSESSHKDRVSAIHKDFKSIGDVLLGESGHLAREDLIFTTEHFRQWTDEKTLRAVSDNLHSVIPQYMDKMDGLIFIIYHLSDEEKMFWDERIPYIVTNFFFPRRAGMAPGVWKLASHCRTQNNNCTWYNKM